MAWQELKQIHWDKPLEAGLQYGFAVIVDRAYPSSWWRPAETLAGEIQAAYVPLTGVELTSVAAQLFGMDWGKSDNKYLVVDFTFRADAPGEDVTANKLVNRAAAATAGIYPFVEDLPGDRVSRWRQWRQARRIIPAVYWASTDEGAFRTDFNAFWRDFVDFWKRLGRVGLYFIGGLVAFWASRFVGGKR